MKINFILTYTIGVALILAHFSIMPVLAQSAPKLLFDGVDLVFSEETNTIDMGKVKQGGASSVNITVKNQSKQVLSIVNVRGSCALSVPSWPRRDIRPGEEGVIQIRYDSSRVGSFNRNVTIHGNTKTSVTVLKVQGVIVPE